MIRIENLTKSFNHHKILDGISLQIKDAEFFCLMGASGQGKTVFLKHLIGLLKPDSGSVNIEGKDIAGFNESQLLLIRRNFGYLFQEDTLFDFMDVYDNLALPIREHTKKSEDEISALINTALEEVELKGIEHKSTQELSGGMKKRVNLARAIILKPKILFCDEPTAGLDPATGLAIARLILKLCRQLHTTTVVVSHDVNNFFNIADRIAIIEQGRIVALGRKEDIEKSQEPSVKRFLLKDIR
ncbi:MAG: ATP-binding cassette domain-containing protein [Candidatus Omnitrophota bacterium]